MVGILDSIGKTPLLRLERRSPPGGARVVLKVEGGNPTGSMKDRMALAMVLGARRDGRLPPEAAVATLAVDTGLKYLTGALFRA